MLRELIGAPVEVGAAIELRDPTVEVPLAAGRGYLAATTSQAVLGVKGVGTFVITDGETITVELASGAPEDLINGWLQGSVAAVLLAQRGRFALHAAVVNIDGVGVALAGPSGVGKTSTALRLVQRGHQLVTDDVSPLSIADPITVVPFDRPIYVSPQVVALLGLDAAAARHVTARRPKVAFPPPEAVPTCLDAVFVIGMADASKPVEVHRMKGAAARDVIWANAYRLRILGALYREQLRTWSGTIAALVPAYGVRRSSNRSTLDALAAEIERIVASRPLEAPPASP
jgi:hypothetical protein